MMIGIINVYDKNVIHKTFFLSRYRKTVNKIAYLLRIKEQLGTGIPSRAIQTMLSIRKYE